MFFYKIMDTDQKINNKITQTLDKLIKNTGELKRLYGLKRNKKTSYRLCRLLIYFDNLKYNNKYNLPNNKIFIIVKQKKLMPHIE